MEISELDTNFSLEAIPSDLEVVYYDVKELPFSVYGVKHDGRSFKRLPSEIARSISGGVASLCGNASGGRVTFETDSPFVALVAEMTNVGKMPHFTTVGSCGFDLYADGSYYRSFLPNYGVKDGYASIVYFPQKQLRRLLLHFPLYSEVKALYIGLAPGSRIAPYCPYEPVPPIVYYGSSITQGGCASRPGNAYPALIAQMDRIDFINLGFSGNALGETAMAEYIAGLPMSAFVLDYDHNAPDVEHLERTHAAFYAAVRRAQPQLPILLVSRPDFDCSEDAAERRRIIYETYRQAQQKGEPVRFVDGGTLWDALSRGASTVDGCHPNDLGFYLMALKIGAALQEMLPGLSDVEERP